MFFYPPLTKKRLKKGEPFFFCDSILQYKKNNSKKNGSPFFSLFFFLQRRITKHFQYFKNCKKIYGLPLIEQSFPVNPVFEQSHAKESMKIPFLLIHVPLFKQGFGSQY